jgi:hypothetical protein
MPMMFFYFLKIIFDISTSKRSKKYKPHSILAKKKKIKFERNTGTNAIPNVPDQSGELQLAQFYLINQVPKGFEISQLELSFHFLSIFL